MTGSKNLRHVIQTVDCIEGAEFDILTIDDPQTSGPCDARLDGAVADFNPNLVVLIPTITAFDQMPSRACLDRIRLNRKIPVVQLYTDLAKPVWQVVSTQLLVAADVAVSLDGTGGPTRDVGGGEVRWLELWTPVSPPAVRTPQRDIDVSMIGSLALFPHRGELLDHLRKNGIDVLTGGGQETSHGLSVEEYFDLLHRSKIVINIARSGARNFTPDGQIISNLKGRVMEALACGALLLESQNDVTPKYLRDGTDYISFATADDLVAKIRFYLADDAARSALAEQGHRTFNERYSAPIFWNRVLEAAASGVRAR